MGWGVERGGVSILEGCCVVRREGSEGEGRWQRRRQRASHWTFSAPGTRGDSLHKRRAVPGNLEPDRASHQKVRTASRSSCSLALISARPSKLLTFHFLFSQSLPVFFPEVADLHRYFSQRYAFFYFLRWKKANLRVDAETDSDDP